MAQEGTSKMRVGPKDRVKVGIVSNPEGDEVSVVVHSGYWVEILKGRDGIDASISLTREEALQLAEVIANNVSIPYLVEVNDRHGGTSWL